MTLADLFKGKSQLIIYHLMFGPEWKEACPSCSFNMDHTDGALVHLAQRDVSFAAISRAAYPKIAAFKKRMGWRFNWVSSNGNDFNRDYHVVFTKEELATGKVDHNFKLEAFPGTDAPGISVFYKDQNGEIFHTYSAYARGTETTMNTYNYLDYVPKGRDEDGLALHDVVAPPSRSLRGWPLSRRRYALLACGRFVRTLNIRAPSIRLMACRCKNDVRPGPAIS